MYILAINGSPRKTWNTAQLLQSALKGAEDCGATTELIHLYDYDFKVASPASAKTKQRIFAVIRTGFSRFLKKFGRQTG